MNRLIEFFKHPGWTNFWNFINILFPLALSLFFLNMYTDSERRYQKLQDELIEHMEQDIRTLKIMEKLHPELQDTLFQVDVEGHWQQINDSQLLWIEKDRKK